MKQQIPPLKCLFYGDPGSGKTRLSYSAALDERTSPILVIDAHGNPESTWDYPQENITVVPIRKIKDLNEPYDFFSEGQPGIHKFRSFLLEEFEVTEVPKFKTVVLDTITDIQRYSFNEALGYVAGPGSFPKKREWEHFNKVLGQMINMATLFYGLTEIGLNVIMTSHEKKKEDRNDGIERYQPLLDGQSDQEVPGKAMLVGRLMHISRLSGVQKRDTKDARKEAEESQIAVFLKPTSTYVAKEQYGAQVDFILDPSITKILDAIVLGRTPNTN